MVFERPTRGRAVGDGVAAQLLLFGSGAMFVVAWCAGWWGTVGGAALCALWIVGSTLWAALRAPAIPQPSPAGGPSDPSPLGVLLDQVPVPLVRVDPTGAHALNRAARALFGTDDRILPAAPALLDDSARHLSHEGRRWRINAVDTGAGHRLLALIDVESEERAAEARAGAEMIDILGHELLNGLSPIVSLADSAVTAAAQGDALLPDILATLARRVEGLEGFTRAYRTLSRLPEPVRAPVALADLAGDLARLFAVRYGDAVVLHVDPPPGGAARVDRDQLAQALWALLQNGAEAALAAAPPATVTLGFALDAGELAVRIADSGSGIAAPDRARIFRPFFTTKPEGSGIGLSLARRIARGHGGELQLLPLGATTFALSVPAA